MQRTFLLSKIHQCTLTAANLNYVGSVSIDEILLASAGILPYEQVQVVNVANGERLITYAIAAPAGSGEIQLNGAAARLGMVGDRLIIMTYGQLSSEELTSFSPTVVLVDDQNRLLQVHRYTDLLEKASVIDNVRA
ncbi:MAG: aspartate 1-decarboxylase [Leptolyngbyaceae cyanobacterium bins.349]|nr:aspartate 1-decarboxylase [Leptolyngbyaceae cyanobacterium bins.349]